MHQSYEIIRGHKADFRVKYRFLTKEEGGRQTIIPHQGYRSDLSYEHKEHNPSQQNFMIWPEFENEMGELILDNEISVPISGTAKMWVINAEYRPYHIGKIQIGLKGFFMEGGRKTAECEVIEVLDLEWNPKVSKK